MRCLACERSCVRIGKLLQCHNECSQFKAKTCFEDCTGPVLSKNRVMQLGQSFQGFHPTQSWLVTIGAQWAAGHSGARFSLRDFGHHDMDQEEA